MKWNRRSRRWSMGALLVIGIVAGVAFFYPRPPSYPPVMIFNNLKTLPNVPPTLVERFLGCVPMTWGWFWRTRDTIFGTPTTVNIDAVIINAKGVTAEDLGDFALRKPTYTNANGLRVWIADEKSLKDLQKTFVQQKRVLFRPRCVTGHEIESSLWEGGSAVVNGKNEDVGLRVETLPRVRGTAVDLMTVIQSTELFTNQTAGLSEDVSLRTNFALASRFQIPQGKGVFVLEDTSKREADGVILLTSLPTPVALSNYLRTVQRARVIAPAPKK